MRRTSISMTWTPDVASEDARLLIRRIEDVYDLLRPHLGQPGQFDPLPSVQVFGAWRLEAAPKDAAYSGVEWIVDRCLNDEKSRILASRYLRLVNLEPWQANRPHFDLCLTDLPIQEDRSIEATHVLGISRRGLVSIISTHPYRDLEMVSVRRLALQHAYAHYLGQMFDVPVPRPDLMEVGGQLYCTNLCAMRATSSAEEALTYGREQALEGVIYCERCQHDLVASITGYYYGLN